jgi:sterol desaturase/sphingolipid hydroxylase (fatty acid hydroxylase superfamily)
MFIIGLIAFTWVEYNVHRYIFHLAPTTQRRANFQYTMHGVHHEFPKDKTRLAMPPLLSITLSTILLLIFRMILGDLVFSFLPGFLVGYAMYLSVHYMVHAYAPPQNFLKVLWVNHAMHHYKDGELVFGVSSPLWDYIYGTMGKNSKEDRAQATATSL